MKSLALSVIIMAMVVSAVILMLSEHVIVGSLLLSITPATTYYSAIGMWR